MGNEITKSKNTKGNNALILVEWSGLLWCVVGLVVVLVSHFAIVAGKEDIFGFEPVNVRNQWVVTMWLIPGFLLMGGGRLLRRYVFRSKEC